MRDTDYKKYYDFIGEAWKLFRKYKDPPDINDRDKQDTYWSNVSDDFSELRDSYGRTAFVDAIIKAFLDELERITRGHIWEADK